MSSQVRSRRSRGSSRRCARAGPSGLVTNGRSSCTATSVKNEAVAGQAGVVLYVPALIAVVVSVALPPVRGTRLTLHRPRTCPEWRSPPRSQGCFDERPRLRRR